MNKISITIALFLLVIGYIIWHINYRVSTKINTVDNLAVTNTQDEKLPFLWSREHYVMENNESTLIEMKEECFSLHELTALFSMEKDVELLQRFCESNAETLVNGYRVSASCRNGSATFYVDVGFTIHHFKWQEWQQNILDVNRNLFRQEKIIFKQRGECHVSN